MSGDYCGWQATRHFQCAIQNETSPWLEEWHGGLPVVNNSAVVLEDDSRVQLLHERAQFGPCSLEVAETLLQLGDACEEQSKYCESENYFHQAAEIASANPYKHDEWAASILMQLSDQALTLGKQGESERWFARAQAIYQRIDPCNY